MRPGPVVRLETVDGRTFMGVERSTFLIDKEGLVRHQVVNDLPLGRNVAEALRMLDALRFHEDKGDVCPANWRPGEEAMKPTPEGVADYLSKHNS